VRRNHVQGELLHQAGESGSLAFGQLEHESGQRCGVDDRMHEWALEPAADQPRIESVVAVLDEDGAVSESQERPACVFELRRADQHRAVDVMALFCVGVDRSPAVHQRVEEGERAVEAESLGAELEHQERCIAGGLDVYGDELSVFQPGLRTDFGGVDRDLLPRHRLCRTARLEEDRLWNHGAGARARRARRISSGVTARSSSVAPA
jgi:hypothetical protein